MDGEVVVERRRQWSPEHKAALLAEVEAEGGQVSVVALEGNGFELPLRERGESGCRAFLAPGCLGLVGAPFCRSTIADRPSRSACWRQLDSNLPFRARST